MPEHEGHEAPLRLQLTFSSARSSGHGVTPINPQDASTGLQSPAPCWEQSPAALHTAACSTARRCAPPVPLGKVMGTHSTTGTERGQKVTGSQEKSRARDGAVTEEFQRARRVVMQQGSVFLKHFIRNALGWFCLRAHLPLGQGRPQTAPAGRRPPPRRAVLRGAQALPSPAQVSFEIFGVAANVSSCRECSDTRGRPLTSWSLQDPRGRRGEQVSSSSGLLHLADAPAAVPQDLLYLHPGG